MRLTVLNLDSARFDCTFGRGCEGVCCRDGRPPVYPEEARRIDEHLHRILPLLRPEARKVVAAEGYLSRRRKAGQTLVRVAAGWCVFFNQGCTLHRLGAAEGAAFRYKPWALRRLPVGEGSARPLVRPSERLQAGALGPGVPRPGIVGRAGGRVAATGDEAGGRVGVGSTLRSFYPPAFLRLSSCAIAAASFTRAAS